MTENVTTYPEWKHAVEQFIEAGFTYGDKIEDEWFYNAFGLQMPTRDMPGWQCDKLELARLRHYTALHKWLLAEHQMLLDRKNGVITVVKPDEQTAYTMNDFTAAVTKEFLRAGDRLRHTAVELLDHEQQRRHADACARIANLKGMMLGSRRRTVELPKPSTDAEQSAAS
jgi:hypothetical protein